eukprot:Amastigsp_a2310_16.p3 type:complete len:160 gc:universal Amastigsp_a2310_16:223-702(+)
MGLRALDCSALGAAGALRRDFAMACFRRAAHGAPVRRLRVSEANAWSVRGQRLEDPCARRDACLEEPFEQGDDGLGHACGYRRGDRGCVPHANDSDQNESRRSVCEPTHSRLARQRRPRHLRRERVPRVLCRAHADNCQAGRQPRHPLHVLQRLQAPAL